MTRLRLAAIGECMLELSGAGAGDPRVLQLGYGGDTLNTAVYLARLGVMPDYVTLLGDDSRSQWMLDSWRREGVGTGLVECLPGRVPGLYLIDTDPDGERHFSYWRGEAPARELFDDESRVQVLENKLADHQLLYFSGITLSLYAEAARDRLFAMLQRLRGKGARVAFDGNYRPRGWPDAEVARSAFSCACEHADMVLPTFDDEQMLFGDATPEDTLSRISGHGVGEIVLKQGPGGCLVSRGGEVRPVPACKVASPLDTTAAGDSFNAGYLAGRLWGEAPEVAANWGHRLASRVIQVHGAIVPAEQMPAELIAEITGKRG